MNNNRAFTLVELVITIVLIGIVAGLGVGLALNVFRGYADSRNKNFLYWEAKFTIERIDREIREALPNSIQVIDNHILKFVKINNGFFYEPYNENSINVFFHNLNNYISTNNKISIYNLNYNQIFSGKRAYKISNIQKINSDNWTITLDKNINKNSPYNRFFTIATPVAYFLEDNKLYRCFNFPLTGNYRDGICNVLTDYISNITFSFEPGTSKRNGLVKISLTLTKNDFSFTYNYEVNIRNVP